MFYIISSSLSLKSKSKSLSSLFSILSLSSLFSKLSLSSLKLLKSLFSSSLFYKIDIYYSLIYESNEARIDGVLKSSKSPTVNVGGAGPGTGNAFGILIIVCPSKDGYVVINDIGGKSGEGW